MSGTPYIEGNPVTIDATFVVGTTPTDPTTVTFNVRKPDGTLDTFVYGVDPQVTRLAEGSYELAYGIPDMPLEYHGEAVGTGTCEATLPFDFYVIPSSVTPPDEPPGPILGPGQTWIAGEDLTNCPGFDPTAQPQLADAAAVEASMVLYEMSGRQFAGRCGPVTVRPANPDGCNHWWGDFQWGGYTWVWIDQIGGWGWWSDQVGVLAGCGWLSRVKLPGYPVRQITQVKINGAVLPATYTSGAPQYRLDQWRYLTRMADPANPTQPVGWPQCQNLALDDDQPGTFSVTYEYGVDPPPIGLEAAKQLACQIIAAQPGSGQECLLPIGATRITRTGVTIDRGLLASWQPDPRTGKGWSTGLVLVDMFLNTVNPHRLQRRPAVISPDTRPYAPRLGEQTP